MRRREFITLLGGAAAAWPLAARAQQPGKIPRLCFLTLDPGSPQSPPRRFQTFFQSLRELGYAHGQTIAIDYLADEGGGNQFPALASDCLRRGADIIAVTTTPAAKAAKAATRSIPIVMVSLADPVHTDLVESLARPGGNVTGMSNMGSELAAKHLEILKEAVPHVSTVLVLTYLVDPIAVLQVEALKKAAPSLGIQLLFHDIRTADDIPAAFDAGARARADGLLVTSASIFGVERARITELAARYRLPAIYPLSLHVTDVDGFLAYQYDEPDLHRRASIYVDKILKGALPADLPVQQPTKFKLLVNLRAAKALGIEIPPMLLARADEVIE
jgi:putative ABC transport system substrate-binding protein